MLKYKLNSPVRESLKRELDALITGGKFNYLPTWFKHFETEEEMVFKVYLWGYLFMTDYFRSKACDAHLELIRRFFSKENEYTAFPRGFGKTTINQLCIAFSCAHHLDEFIPVIEKSWDEASNVLLGVRDIFNGHLIKQAYGELVGREVGGEEAEKMPDAKGDLFINGVRLRALGFNKTIRGLKHKAWRPTRIVVDDVESEEHIGSPEQREKYMDNYMKGIVPSVDINGTIKVTGTILHFDSLLWNLVEGHNGLICRAYDKKDPKNTLLWPDLWSWDALEKKRLQMEQDGIGSDAFYQEYLNEPIGEENRVFKWEWLNRTYKEEDLKFKDLNYYACFDVADSTTDGSDYTGVVVVGVDSEDNWYVKSVHRYRLDILSLINKIFEVWNFEGMRKIGVEKKAFEDQVKPLLDSETSKRGIFPIVEELKHGGRRKIDRIKGALQGKFRQGKIFFKEGALDDTNILKEELYSISSNLIASKNDDLGDSLAYISQISELPMSEQFKARYQRTFEPRRIDPFAKKNQPKGARTLFRS